MKYFVHRYDVVRVKVAVEANSQQAALIAADEYLATNHPIPQYHEISNHMGYNNDAAIADHYGYPTWLEFGEPGQEVTSYLVDVVGDADYIHTCNYDQRHQSRLPRMGQSQQE